MHRTNGNEPVARKESNVFIQIYIWVAYHSAHQHKINELPVFIFPFACHLVPSKKKSILTDWMWSETSQMGECLVSFNGNVRNCWLTVTFVRQFDENKVAWVAGLATIGAVEFMAAAVALFILRRLQVCVTFFPVWTILFFFYIFFISST